MTAIGMEVKLVLRGEMSHTVTMGKDVYGNLTRIENALANMPQNSKRRKNGLPNWNGRRNRPRRSWANRLRRRRSWKPKLRVLPN